MIEKFLKICLRLRTPKLRSDCFVLRLFFFPCLFLSLCAFLFSVRDEQKNSTRSQASKTLAQICVWDGTCVGASCASLGAGGRASCSATLWQPILLSTPVLPAVRWPRSCAALRWSRYHHQMFVSQFVSWGWERSPAQHSGEGEMCCHLWQLSIAPLLCGVWPLRTMGRAVCMGSGSESICPFSVLRWTLVI